MLPPVLLKFAEFYCHKGVILNNKFWLVIISTFIILSGIFFVFRPKQQNNEVVFWTLQMNDFAPYINGVISDFEKENPDIKIKWVDVPFSEGEKRTLASVLSDNPPDLVNLNPDFHQHLPIKVHCLKFHRIKPFNLTKKL